MLLTVTSYPGPTEQIENETHMAQSWFVAKAAVALSPVVILTTADVIG